MHRRASDLGRAIDSPALEGKALTNIAETLAWTNPAEGAQAADDAIELNSTLGNQLEVLKANVARIAKPRAASDVVQRSLQLLVK